MRRFMVPLVSAILLMVAFLPGCTIMQTENKSPIAVFSATPSSINVDETVLFSANESKDKDGKIMKYSWDFGDGAFALGAFTEHTYESGGDFTVTLIVKDDSGSVDKANTTVHVNEWPKAEGRAGKDPAKVFEDIDFDASYSSDKDGSIVEYHWDFGDDRDSTGVSPCHKYSKVGTYNVTLTVKDNDGATAVHTFKVQVIKRHYKVLWDEASRTFDTLSDYTNENTTMNKTVEITMTNLTALEFNMTWSDHIPVVGAANDEFILEVESPDGDIKKLKTTTELISHRFKIDDLPDTISMEGETSAELEKFIATQYTSSKGQGDWMLRITCVEAGDWYLDQFDVDNGNDWDIEIIAYYYSASIIETG